MTFIKAFLPFLTSFCIYISCEKLHKVIIIFLYIITCQLYQYKKNVNFYLRSLLLIDKILQSICVCDNIISYSRTTHSVSLFLHQMHADTLPMTSHDFTCAVIKVLKNIWVIFHHAFGFAQIL